MAETIRDKISVSTMRIFRENLDIMVEFGLISGGQKEFVDRIMCAFKYGDHKLGYDDIDSFIEYNKELFDDKFIELIAKANK